MNDRSQIILLGLALAAALLAGLAALLIGPANLAPGAALRALVGVGDPRDVMIVQEIRLPRALAAFLAGAALGASGAGLQGLLRNPLADPGVLGVSSAAALGAVIAVYFNLAAAAPDAPAIAAIIFAIGATALVHALGAGRISATRLILVGVGLSSVSSAMIALVMNLAPNPFVLSDLVNWLFGTVANRSFADLALAAPAMAAGFLLLVFARGGLAALALGEETAAALGADIARTRALTIFGAALMTGGAVALAGAIGFVGIVAPHLARPLARHDAGALILPAAAFGGAILALADLAVRLLPFDQEMRLGVAAALIGAPVFVWIAARTEKLAP
jgi:iron complex transport system permease protein